MAHELNPEHAEVARTALEKIRAHIAKAVFRAAEIIDISNVEELEEEPEQS